MRLPILLSLLLVVASPVRVGAMEVVSDGRYKGSAEEYRVGKTVYLSAKDVGAVYGAQVYWFPVSGRLRLSLRGRQLELMVGSDTATLDGKRIPLGAQVILKGTEAFMPAGLLAAKEFSAWTGLRADLDGGKVLSVEKVSSVGPMRWSTHGGHTRLVVELEEGLVYKGSDRGVGGMDVVVLRGAVGAARAERVDDGRVASVSLAQEAGLARVSVKYSVDGLKWKVSEIKDPRRLIVDVYSGDDPPPAMGARPAPSGTAVLSLQPPRIEAAGSAATNKAEARDGPAASSKAAVVVPDVPKGQRKFRVVIDPGHGGKDSGAVGKKGTLEKDVVLAVSRALARRLEEEDSLEVLMTRGDDYFVPLAERSQAANEFGSDLFISVHCNSSPKKIDNGFEIYFLSETASDPDAARLADLENSVLELEGKSVEEEAEIILRAMSRTEYMNDAARFAAVLGRNLAKRLDIVDRGVKQAGFYVLRGTDAPAVLLEIAYLSHRKDEARLSSKSVRKKVVEGIYKGIMEYVKEKQQEQEGRAL